MNLKEQIKSLSQQGYGYKKIAKELNVSIGSVRNALVDAPKSEVCKNCGKKLRFVVGKKKKTFCCDSCRYTYWNIKRKEGKKHGK